VWSSSARSGFRTLDIKAEPIGALRIPKLVKEISEGKLMTRSNLCSAAPTGVPDWSQLYLTALFETDKQKLPSRIAEAERAMTLRARELFTISCHNSEEGRAVDKGLYALRALRTCLELNRA